jgi:type II secretory pathway pseudopilin PulG
MVAMVVFVIISTATVAIIIQALQTLRENEARIMAANIARSQLEMLKLKGASGLTQGTSDPQVVEGANAQYVVLTTATLVGKNQTSGPCDSASPGTDYWRVHVEVFPPSEEFTPTEERKDQVVIDSIIPRDETAPLTNVGSAAITVVDENGQENRNIVVTGTDANNVTNNFTYTTGPDGCIFVPNLKPSTSLFVSVSHLGDPPYVPETSGGDIQLVPIATGVVARPTFHYAPASTIQFGGLSTEYPPPADLDVTWQVADTGTTVQRGTLSTPVTGLWPNTRGFVAYAGRCADADPSTYVGQTRQSFAFAAGQTTVAGLRTAPVKLRGLPASATVVAKYTGSDASCPTVTFDLGTTDALGILKVGLPFGSWEFATPSFAAPLEGEKHAVTSPLTPQTAETTDTVNFTLENLDNLPLECEDPLVPNKKNTKCVEPPTDPLASPSPSASPAPEFSASPSP